MFDIVVLVPHPDDESALCAGLILRALSKSARVQVVFITSGKNGRTLGLVTRKALAGARRKEAVLASAALGVHDVHFLDYPDFNPRSGKFSTWPGVKKKLLAATGPISTHTVIVSFPPNGMNGHPDHVRCSVLASELAKDKKAALLFVTNPVPAATLGMTSYAPEPHRQERHVPPTHAMELTPAEIRRKLLALSCYRTQAISILDFLRQEQGNISREHFSLAEGSRQAEKFLSGVLRVLPE